MQVKLWSANEKGMKAVANEPEYKRLGISIAKLVNLAVSQYLVARKEIHKSKKP
jgi:hypothetical protein